MNKERIHRAVSDDGTETAGRVYGQGPSLVFVHGAVADGESEWAALVPLLTDQFTCYLPSTRGRGLSGTHPDHSSDARVNDVTAFVESIGQPVGLVGVSGGGMLALGAAARTSALTAVAALEPIAFQVASEEFRSRFRDAVERMAEAIEEGGDAEAIRPFVELIANDEERAALGEDPAATEELTAYLPVDLAEFREELDGDGPRPTNPSALARIAAPTLLLHGSDTALDWFTDSTRYAAEHIPGATMREIAGNGHLGHLLYPERVAEELIRFFAAAYQPA